jgi:hypothetical protein
LTGAFFENGCTNGNFALMVIASCGGTLEHNALKAENVEVANAFTEPVYERLRLKEGDRTRIILAFTRTVPKHVRELIRSKGGTPARLTAPCYCELWELPGDTSQAVADMFPFDQMIAEGLGILEGKFPSGGGYWVPGTVRSSENSDTSPLLRTAGSARAGYRR